MQRSLFLTSTSDFRMHQDQLYVQRELYAHLLQANTIKTSEVQSFLEQALKLLISLTGARIGYMEWKSKSALDQWTIYQCKKEEEQGITESISSGIVAEAIRTNQIVTTNSAMVDPRFMNNVSIQGNKIETVLCVPLTNTTHQGVVYLQGKANTPFSINGETNLLDTDLFVKHISPLLSYLNDTPELSTMETLRQEFQLNDIIGESDALQNVLQEAMNIAALEVNVLITGPSGTGKSQLAKCIHKNGSRSGNPFIAINCANLPEALVENELFGAASGAHSGAVKSVKGKIDAASGGTLFLDEIGELPLTTQAKLLQFLEEGIYFPLGSSFPKQANVRVIAATNVDLKKASEEKTFREDLYYRLCVFPIELPALDERQEDVLHLSQYFCEKYQRQFKFPDISLSKESLNVLRNVPWPGNVRQLDHVIQQGLIRAVGKRFPEVMPEHLFPNLDKMEELSHSPTDFKRARGEWERNFLRNQLDAHNWNISETAKNLGLSRSHTNNLIKEHQLSRAPS